MIKIEKSILIRCPVERVFTYLTALDNGLQWQSGTLEEKIITPGPVRPGTTFHNITEFVGRRLESTLQVTEYEPNKKFVFKSISALVPIQMTHLFETVPEGTRISIIVQGELDGFYKVGELLVTRQANQKVETDLKNLKRLMEAEP